MAEYSKASPTHPPLHPIQHQLRNLTAMLSHMSKGEETLRLIKEQLYLITAFHVLIVAARSPPSTLPGPWEDPHANVAHQLQ